MEYWNGILEWSTGLDNWSGRGDITSMRIIIKSSHRDKLMIWHFIESQSRYIG